MDKPTKQEPEPARSAGEDPPAPGSPPAPLAPPAPGSPPAPLAAPAPSVAAVLGLSALDRLLIVVGAPALGLAAGYLLPRGADWVVSSLSWVPMRGPLELIASFDGSWALIAFLVAGLVLGLGVAYAAIVESLRVTVTASEIRLDRDERSRTIARADVDSVFLDGEVLVLLDGESRQLARERHAVTAGEVERVLRAYGYPWVDADPYADLWRRWVPHTPDLSASVNAVLTAREVALREKATKDVAELGDEVQRQGYAIRDDGVRQYWRPLVRS